MIDTENLTKKFGNLTAVDSLTLHVNDDEVFGFSARMAPGKTTTIRTLCCTQRQGTKRISKDKTDGGQRIIRILSA